MTVQEVLDDFSSRRRFWMAWAVMDLERSFKGSSETKNESEIEKLAKNVYSREMMSKIGGDAYKILL